MRTEFKMEKTVVHETKEYIFIQYLRVIALLLVLWDHIIPGVYYKMGVMPPASIVERYIIWPLAITNYFGAYAVDLFFLITGFLAMESVKKTGPISYLIKRGTRLVPGILFGYLLYIALHGGGGIFDTERLPPDKWQLVVCAGLDVFLRYFCLLYANFEKIPAHRNFFMSAHHHIDLPDTVRFSWKYRSSVLLYLLYHDGNGNLCAE